MKTASEKVWAEVFGVLEKDLNLAIVYKLKTLFENKGFRVVLTRTDDKVLADKNSKNVKVEDLHNRVALITETMPSKR